MKKILKDKLSEGAKTSKDVRREQVMMLRAQGYTIRQICSALKIKSTTTVLNDIKSGLEISKERANFTPEEYRDLELNRCAERAGRLAEWRDKIETIGASFEKQIEIFLSIEDRDLKNQDKLIKLLGLETIKIEPSEAFDFNLLRERAMKAEERDRELELHPELSGRVR